MIDDFLNSTWSIEDDFDMSNDYNEFANNLSQQAQALSIVYD
ncbi:MAG: hypothetical protein PHY32_00615 [Candidatus Pacebacteria bacterium]|nr:hypothetical protein [Candidatus Paceibacterota bacterium]